jgi:two-component system, NtrC family, response regulator AtoC
VSRLFLIAVDAELQRRAVNASAMSPLVVAASSIKPDEKIGSVGDVVIIGIGAAESLDAGIVQRSSARWLVSHDANHTDAELAGAIAHRIAAHDIIDLTAAHEVLSLRLRNLQRDVDASTTPRTELRQPRKSDVIIGSGAWHKELFDRINMVAVTDVAIAIFGESGTGKELVARTIHRSSLRRDAPFVVVNCAAIPEALLEDELFGHVKGAFTDATRDREGLIAAAAGGTLFLDEIGELPLQVQAKLLRFLQSHDIRRIGDDTDRHIDVRVVTATNRDLERAIVDGSFREDLYYRIAVFALRLPPLRERRNDIPLLVHHVIGRLQHRLGKSSVGISSAAMAALANYPFPGNIRELENKLHHALVVAAGPMIEANDLGLSSVSLTGHNFDLHRPFRDLKNEAVAKFERAYIEELLASTGGNIAEAARRAGIDRKNIWALLKRYGMQRLDFAKST